MGAANIKVRVDMHVALVQGGATSPRGVCRLRPTSDKGVGLTQARNALAAQLLKAHLVRRVAEVVRLLRDAAHERRLESRPLLHDRLRLLL